MSIKDVAGKYPPPYPEHAKANLVLDETRAIESFIDESPYVLAEYVPCDRYHRGGGRCSLDVHLVPVHGVERAVAEHYGIDLATIEVERREMLEAQRRLNEGT